MKSALSDFISGKKGIYGILHIIILVMSLFLVISISVDTFKGIPFYTQSSYMKTQLWICIWFLFDFVLEFFLAKHKGRYLRTHFIFLLVAIPYQNIIAYYGWTFSPEITYLLRFIPLLRGGSPAQRGQLRRVFAVRHVYAVDVQFHPFASSSCFLGLVSSGRTPAFASRCRTSWVQRPVSVPASIAADIKIGR